MARSKFVPLFLMVWTLPAAAADLAPVEFNRDIRPILSDTCFQCHGPDKAKRKANLRLDTEAGAFADLGGYHALVAGNLEHSELFHRISAADEAKRMPPAKFARKLTLGQIDLLRRWIEQGAKWQRHWAFIPPSRPPLPPVKDAAWPRNPIDHFVLARLERETMNPAPEADPVTLLRRVTLDLAGLPPTPEELDDFLRAKPQAAYERVVDRLLASPRYGERVARPWLDAARYADTNGYQTDGERHMWRWRDGVIDAFNRNLPFDQFTIEQLAGDLLPRPTLDQRIATGFNRNHRGNAEGGIIPEEYAVEYVVDRVDTTATVWLGLTLGCARCHDHKYDPFPQKEYYQLFAYFNNVPERGKAIKLGNSPPVIQSPTVEQERHLAELDRRLEHAERRFADLRPKLTAAQATWEQTLGNGDVEWNLTEGRVARFERTAFDGKRHHDAGDVADFGFLDKFTLSAWVKPTSATGTILSRMSDSNRGIEGYQLHLEAGKVQLNLVKRWLDDAIRVETHNSIRAGQWTHVLATYDGSRLASGIAIYLNGRPARLTVHLDDLNQTFQTKEPLRIGSSGGDEGRFQGLLDEVMVYHRTLAPDEAAMVATRETVSAIAALPPESRAAGQALKVRACFLERYAPTTLRNPHRTLISLRDERARLIQSFPTTMVMEEMPTPRATFILNRGEYDKPGEPVSPGVPAHFELPMGNPPNNRLGFARWLVHPKHPLTARVAVNRVWQSYFGQGIVKTVDDFGAQGEWPTHPELLDWLATEFVRSGWDTKALHRLIVTSATYRQSAKLTPALLQRDPENRLLARGSRFRLSAETIRDQALAASGLLVERLGGPSVKPYQPAGLARELGAEAYRQDHGANLYRRGLYTFWKRTVTPPTMMTFDAAGRETCVVRETRTNTPLQALTLMNDITYVEAARVLAQRIMIEGGKTPEERLTLAFRLVTGRRPRPVELAILVGAYHEHHDQYHKNPSVARKMAGSGESPRDERLSVPELAAYSTVAGMILNLDEAINKE